MGDTTRLRRSSDSLPDPKPPQWGLEFFRPARVPVARTREREPRAARRLPHPARARGRGSVGSTVPYPSRQPDNPSREPSGPGLLLWESPRSPSRGDSLKPLPV